jgi:hypothetical protein
VPLFRAASDLVTSRYEDKEVQRDKKLVSYDIVDKQTKPYIKVKVNGEDKVRMLCLTESADHRVD